MLYIYKMNFINSLISDRFSVFNVSEEKRPVTSLGNGLVKWEQLTYDELCNEHNFNIQRWGIKLGKHENNRRIMSFDFDCCGEENKSTGERVGCEYTKHKLNEYMENEGDSHADGLYYSSTKGNMNLLIDYSHSQKLINIIEELAKLNIKNKFKPQSKSLEILFGGCQVIPPSATKCKVTKKLGNPRTFLNNEPFHVLDEDDDSWAFNYIYSFFTTHLNEQLLQQRKKKVALLTPPSTPTHEIGTGVYQDIYLDLLNNVIGNGCNENGSKKIAREDWLAICYVLKSNNYNKSVFIDYSTPQADIKKNTAEKTWDTLKIKNISSLYILQGIAKKYNPYHYDKWFIKNKKYIKIEVLNKGENDVARYISDFLGSKIIYCNKNWWVFDDKMKIWRYGTPDAIVITEMQRQIDIARKCLFTVIIEEEDEEKKKAYRKLDLQYKDYYSIVGRSGFATQTIKCLKEYLLDVYFEEKLDVYPYKIAYKNGMLHLKTLTFVKGLKAEDYLTSYIPYDYEEGSEEDIKTITHELKKICNYKDDHLGFYLSFLGYSMTGDSSLIQGFFNLLGQKASNGKSIIFETLMSIIPNYVKKAESDLFECNYGSRHKEIATWRGIRLLWLNELTKKKQDGEVIKDICDGTQVPYKIMYGIVGKMPITFKMAVVSNNTLKIDADRGIARRLNTLQMNSDFVDGVEDNFQTKVFKKDPLFGEKLKNEYKFALMTLIYRYSKAFVDDGYKMKPCPAEWKQVSENIVQNSNKFNEYFNRWFIEENEASINKWKLDQHLKDFNQNVNIGDELMRMKINFTYNSQKKGKGSNGIKGVYEGFRLKTPHEIAEEEKEEVEEEEKKK